MPLPSHTPAPCLRSPGAQHAQCEPGALCSECGVGPFLPTAQTRVQEWGAGLRRGCEWCRGPQETNGPPTLPVGTKKARQPAWVPVHSWDIRHGSRYVWPPADQRDTGSVGELGPPSPCIPGSTQWGEGSRRTRSRHLAGLPDGRDPESLGQGKRAD